MSWRLELAAKSREAEAYDYRAADWPLVEALKEPHN